jgi:DnaJ like chaperone protein
LKITVALIIPDNSSRIDRSASAAEIKQAYRELALKYHPDKLEHLGDDFKALAEIRFKEIQKAYQELSGNGS